jgi:hypothetical protein
VPNTLLDQVTKSLNMVSQLALVLVFAPWVALVLPLLLPAYAWVYRWCARASDGSL